jgi:transitional endoplasmic reticulum ATPase
VSTVPKGIVHIDENTEVELREVYEEAHGPRGGSTPRRVNSSG